jgi:hydrogenase expression/formation protein HypC
MMAERAEACHPMCLAIPGRIVEISPDTHDSGVVEVAGVRRRVNLSLLRDDPPGAGDWVLIHVGFAMSRIGEAEALEQMRILALLGESDAAVEDVRGLSVDDPEPS